jgi:hypothetical protein
MYADERKSPSRTDDTVMAVRITDVHIKFFSLMWLMVKAALAAIPAAIILAVIWLILGGVLGLGGDFLTHLMRGGSAPTSL